MNEMTRRALIRLGGAATLCSLNAVTLETQALPGQDPPSQGGAHAATPPIRARLSLNENAFGSSPRVAPAIRDSLAAGLSRYTEGEADRLTTQVAALEDVTPEHVVLGEVLQPLGIQLGISGGPGGEFIYSAPGFTDLVDAAARVGGVAVPVPLNGRLENDLHAIAARTGAHTRAVYLVNPHNPSGTVSPAGAFKAFVAELARRTLVIVDEAYLEFTDSFASRTVAPLVKAGHDVIVFRTFDKAYGLAALQFGYVIAPTKLADELREQGLGAAHSLDRLAVVGAAAALRDTQFIAETRRKTAAERARWNAALDRLHLRHTDSQGNFVFFQTGRPHEAVRTAFLAQGIDIGRGFPPLDEWARITIGLPEENTLAIAALRKIFRR